MLPWHLTATCRSTRIASAGCEHSRPEWRPSRSRWIDPASTPSKVSDRVPFSNVAALSSTGFCPWGSTSLPTLKALTRAAGPIVLANASDAARAQIDAYHTQVAAWRRDLRPDEWSRLRVVVLGKQMPRKHNVAIQYFAKLLGVPDESRRLVYAEELSGEQQGLNLLATHQLDSELSEAFFDDPDRMEIDLLGNAASVYLDGFDFHH